MSKDMTTKTKNEVAETGGVFDIKENMEGIEARLPQIKIIHQGQMFGMPNGEKVSVFNARILDISRTNAYWAESFDSSGGGTPPECYSMDGIKPSDASEKKQSDACASCAMNKFGSDRNNTGKACKNMKRVHVMLAGENQIIPFRLTVPPSNLMALDTYITNLSGTGLAYQLVSTVFSLRETKSKGGIAYSTIILETEPGSEVTDRGAQEAIKARRDEWMSVMRQQDVLVAEV